MITIKMKALMRKLRSKKRKKDIKINSCFRKKQNKSKRILQIKTQNKRDTNKVINKNENNTEGYKDYNNCFQINNTNK